MNREELRERISKSAVIRRRSGSPGALVRGWRIASVNALGDPAAAQAAGRLLRDLTAEVGAESVVGIERSGTVLSRSIAAEAARDGVPLQEVAWDVARSAPATSGGLASSAIVIDDVVNSGLTMRRAIRGLESLGTEVLAAACLIQYPNGRPLGLRNWNHPLLSAFSLRDLQLRRFTWPMRQK